MKTKEKNDERVGVNWLKGAPGEADAVALLVERVSRKK